MTVPIGPSTTPTPPVMYSNAYFPAPSTTMVAQELRSADALPNAPFDEDAPAGGAVANRVAAERELAATIDGDRAERER